MRPHKIGLNLAFIGSDHLTGPGFYARELAERLVEQTRGDPSVELVCYIQSPARHHFTGAVQETMVPIAPLSGRVKRVLWEHLRLPWIARRAGLDLLFSPAFVSPLFGAPSLVATIHDMYYHVVPELIDPAQRRFWGVMIPLTARRCDALITVSESTRRDLEVILPAARGKSVAIPLGSRYARADYRLPPLETAAPPYVLFVANVTANKNPATIMEAMRTLRDRGIPLHLVHVGADPFGLLAACVDNSGLADAVIQLGKVSDEALQALYQNALCTVHPSLYEGFGLPVLEAQALGSPLVCSNRGALPETAGDGALLVDPTSAEEIADAIAELHRNPACRTALIERGYINLARFSWDRTAAETLALFRRVIADKSPTRRLP